MRCHISALVLIGQMSALVLLIFSTNVPSIVFTNIQHISATLSFFQSACNATISALVIIGQNSALVHTTFSFNLANIPTNLLFSVDYIFKIISPQFFFFFFFSTLFVPIKQNLSTHLDSVNNIFTHAMLQFQRL